MALSIHHLGIAVSDLDASIEQYAALFGATVEHRETVGEQGVEAASLRVGPSRVELLQPLGADTPVGQIPRKPWPGAAPRRVRGRRLGAELDRCVLTVSS